MTDLSIILVSWNTREMTLACLRTLYAQTRQTAFEVLLVDNGSADGSAEAIAAEFPQVRLLAEGENHGFGRANNIAGKIAQGRRLLLLNTDTLVLDGAIDKLWRFAESRPAAGIWGGRTVFGDGSLNRSCAFGAMTVWSTFSFAFGLTQMFPRSDFFNSEIMAGWGRDTVREVDIVSGCFFLIDVDLWRRLDGFDPEFFMYGEEAELCARARELGASPVCTPEATIVHYGGGSATQRSDSMVRMLKGKIQLARWRLGSIRAAIIRRLFLVAVFVRWLGFGAKSLLDPRAGGTARLWREILARRAEWF